MVAERKAQNVSCRRLSRGVKASVGGGHTAPRCFVYQKGSPSSDGQHVICVSSFIVKIRSGGLL